MTVIASRDRIRGDKEFEQRKQSFWSACLVFKERSSVIFLAWACWKRNKWAHWKRQASHQWTSIFRCGKKSIYHGKNNIDFLEKKIGKAMGSESYNGKSNKVGEKRQAQG